MRTLLFLIAIWGTLIALGSAVFLVMNQVAQPSLTTALFNGLGIVAGSVIAVASFRRAMAAGPNTK
jgi:hypothetical protein